MCAGLVLAATSGIAEAETASAGCSSAMQANYPKASISSGPVQAVLYLPDAKNGYYRASRFDWSGVIPCLAYKGHTYFGVWFSHYDPMIADAITGPVEEFRSTDGALDYDQAKPGGLFVKIGVGVLRKADDSPYKFMYTYPLVDGGKWTVHAGRRQVSFRQQLRPYSAAQPEKYRDEDDRHAGLRPRLLHAGRSSERTRNGDPVSLCTQAGKVDGAPGRDRG